MCSQTTRRSGCMMTGVPCVCIGGGREEGKNERTLCVADSYASVEANGGKGYVTGAPEQCELGWKRKEDLRAVLGLRRNGEGFGAFRV